MAVGPETQDLKDLANRHLWMHSADWTQMAERGGPLIAVEGKGIRITDSDGNSWIDVIRRVRLGERRVRAHRNRRRRLRADAEPRLLSSDVHDTRYRQA